MSFYIFTDLEIAGNSLGIIDNHSRQRFGSRAARRSGSKCCFYNDHDRLIDGSTTT